MAQIREVRLVDDLNGDEAAESVEFSIDGKAFEIDLSEEHAAQLRDAFAPYVTAGRRVGGAGRRQTTTAPRSSFGRSRQETHAIREWGSANGFQVSERGRIPSEVLEAYERRGAESVAAPTAASAAQGEPDVVIDEATAEATQTDEKPKRARRSRAKAKDGEDASVTELRPAEAS